MASEATIAGRRPVTLAAALLAALLLGGCGPGTGGTGLPPGAAEPSLDASSPAPVGVAPPAPTSALAAPRLPPSRAADVEGPIERADDASLAIAGRVLPRATTDVVLPDGVAAPPDAVAVGRFARAWLEGGRWLVLLR